MSATAAAVFGSTRPALEELPTSTPLSRVVPFSSMTPAFAQSLRAIQNLMRLPDNWDTYGSPRVQQDAAQRAVQVLAAAEAVYAPVPRIVPVAGGGLQVEWTARGRELEIEMLPNGSIEILTVEDEQMTETPLQLERVNFVVPMLLRWLSGEKAYAAAIR